jgi:hypothetical protein
MAFLHMVTQDPARTPTFVYFADPDFFLTAGRTAVTCTPLASCSDEQPGFNWSHGDYQEQITKTWLGMVGPGVRAGGKTARIFSDHTDIRPTVLSLAGLTDDYAHDGRVLFEVLEGAAVPRAVREHEATLSRLASAFKSINAPVGELGRKTLKLSTDALAGSDATFADLEQSINDITARRNAIADRMIAVLEAVSFHGAPVDVGEAESLIAAANDLIRSVD